MKRPPSFYRPDRIGTVFHPDNQAIAESAAAAGLPPAIADKKKVHLLIVDMQADFCHKTGSLYVPGAESDIRRLVEFIYRHCEHITDITCSLDSHLPFQIFHSAWWVGRDGNHPEPFTVITHNDVVSGKWRAIRQPEWSTSYVQKLQKRCKKELVVWPYHVLIGSAGHSLDQELFSAVLWHALARDSQPTWWTKGSIPETEHYSILRPEIPVPGNPFGRRRRQLLDMLRGSDYIFIAGEASSHCVLETIEDLVEEFSGQPEMLARLHVLRDCTSPVRHPQIDFESITRQRFSEFERLCVRFLDSTGPMPF